VRSGTMAHAMERRLLMLITEDWYFWSHRRHLARSALAAGWEVALATRVGELGEPIRALGVRLLPIGLRRARREPLGELASIAELARLMRRERPGVLHNVGVKPMLYGSWAARLAGVRRVVNAQPGLGYVFAAPGVRAAVLRAAIGTAYRSAWAGAGTRVIFQNRANLEHFVGAGMVARERAVLIPGCGADLEEFAARPLPEGPPVIMYAGRLLRDKGLAELAAAAARLRADGIRCRVVLVGRPDPSNPESLPEEQLRGWVESGLLEWWGYRREMAETLAAASIVVLPSYAEGLPKVLVEAAAVGRPIVASDVPGCREVVRHGANGLLVPARDAGALHAALRALAGDRERCAEMGRRGRALAEREFSAERLSAQTVALYESLLEG